MKKTKKLALLAVLAAAAMVLSFVESQIPAFVAIPGVKIGLANIAVIVALYRLGPWEAAAVSGVRVVVVSMLFGNLAAFMYSLAGAALSLCGMALLKRSGAFSCTAVSVCGGVLHNLGQIAMACVLLGTNSIAYYLPFLVLSGTMSGAVIGLASALLTERLGKAGL